MIDSGTVTLVMTVLVKTRRVTLRLLVYGFIQTWYHVMFIPVHDLPLSAIVLAGNNRIALLKASFTRIYSVTSRMHACFVHKNAQKNFN